MLKVPQRGSSLSSNDGLKEQIKVGRAPGPKDQEDW